MQRFSVRNCVNRWGPADGPPALPIASRHHLTMLGDVEAFDLFLRGGTQTDQRLDDVEIERRGSEVDAGTAQTMTLEEYRDLVRERRSARARR